MQWQMTIPRVIPTTDFTRRNGLAGRDPRTVFLYEALHGGVFGFAFRQVSSGNFYCTEVYESTTERAICHAVHYALRRKLRFKSEDLRAKLLELAKESGLAGQDQQVIGKTCDLLGNAVGQVINGTHAVVSKQEVHGMKGEIDKARDTTENNSALHAKLQEAEDNVSRLERAYDELTIENNNQKTEILKLQDEIRRLQKGADERIHGA